MGNQPSIPYQKLSRVLPQNHEVGWDEGKWVDKGFQAFRNAQDRDQFICSLLSLVSQNGKTKLEDHEFKLLFSRKPNDRMVATLVAMKEGVIEAKIEPRADGVNQAEAFRAFKKHVESSLHELLETVPDAAAMPGISIPSSSSNVIRSPTVPDLPPAYETGNNRVSTGGKKG